MTSLVRCGMILMDFEQGEILGMVTCVQIILFNKIYFRLFNDLCYVTFLAHRGMFVCKISHDGVFMKRYRLSPINTVCIKM